MSSVLAHTAQISPRRSAFLIAGADTVTWSVSSGFTVQQVMTTAAFAAATATSTTSGLLKDMGDEVRTVDSTGYHTASFRRVQSLIDGQGTEGVNGTEANGYLTFYVCVWSADTSAVASESYPAVTVTRTG